MKRIPLFSAFLLAMTFGACKDGGGDDAQCVDGYETCSCTAEGYCLGGLKCASGLCVNPGDITGPGDGDGDGDDDDNGDGDGDGDGTGTSKPPDMGGGCIPGSWNCECKYGDSGCAAGLDCEDEICVEEQDQCIDPFDQCYDNDEGFLGSCCEDRPCLGTESSNIWGCAPSCEKHSDCGPSCCVYINGLFTEYCSQTDNCATLCVDTCGAGGVYDGGYAGDGWCDDGGPGSDYSDCELGTDCTDCGARYP